MALTKRFPEPKSDLQRSIDGANLDTRTAEELAIHLANTAPGGDERPIGQIAASLEDIRATFGELIGQLELDKDPTGAHTLPEHAGMDAVGVDAKVDATV